MSKLLRLVTVGFRVERGYAQKRYNWQNEGIQYFGFKYYPRHSNFQDPLYTPTKLFRAQRIKPLKGVPYYEKKILEQFKLGGKASDIAIIKNIPENNQRLWKIKHLIEIQPITFPDGFPPHANNTYLQENGQLRVTHTFKQTTETLQLTDEFQKKPERLDGDTLRRDSRMKWLNPW